MAGGVVRSGERPGGVIWLPVVGAFTGAFNRIKRAVPSAVLLPLSKVGLAETSGPDLREQEVMAQITFYGQHTRSGKVHVTRRTSK